MHSQAVDGMMEGQYGRVIHNYQPGNLRPIGVLLVALFVILSLLVVPTGASSLMDYVALLIMAMMATAVGVYGIMHFTLAYAITSEGVVRSRYGKPRFIAWDDVRTISQRIQTSKYGRHISCTVVSLDGRRIRLGGGASDRKLMHTIEILQSEHGSRKGPAVLQEMMSQAAAFQFGKISISPSEIGNSSRTYAWDVVLGIEVQRFDVKVMAAGRWHRLASIHHVPNLGVLMWVARARIEWGGRR
jgi:hypothetical protein